jgi:hypothetical protein
MLAPRFKLLMSLNLIAVVAYVVWSYSLTDPNLVLTSFSPYWNLQQWLWKHVWQQPQVLSSSYLLIIGLWFGSYAAIIHSLFTTSRALLQIHKLFLIVISLGVLLAYNAQSHDIFNYIFNAKMVLQYQLDPHVHTAIELPNDLWTRFMHNTHTPAPYGYGWTAFSVLPFLLTQNSFTLSWFAFKALNLLALILLWKTLLQFNERVFHFKNSDFEKKLFVLYANPLFLIEILGNGHNDLWMMLPAVVALLLVMRFQQTHHYKYLAVAILAFVFSLTTKWATLAIAPLAIILIALTWFKQLIPKLSTQLNSLVRWFETNWPTLASICMFLPLFTDRSQQFHPWYLVWALVWLPLMPRHLWTKLLLIFTLSSMLRYLPWMLAGGYSSQVLLEQRVITWGIPLIWLIMSFVYAKIFSSK